MNAMRIMIASFTLATLTACGGGGDVGGFASGPTAPVAAQPHPFATPSVTLAQAPAAAQSFAKEMKAKSVAKATNPLDPYNGVDKTKAFRQGHKFAEDTFPDVFVPGAVTETYLPGDGTTVEYRKYWNAHYQSYIYLGFARDVPAGSVWVEAGVYLLGVPWGPNPVQFGIISDYYTPVAYTLYKDKVYALWTNAYPHIVTMAGAVRVTNTTEWNGQGKDLFSCIISKAPIEGGAIPVLCKDLANLRYRELYIDPMSNELRVFTDTLPANLEYTLDQSGQLTWYSDGWGGVQQPDPTHPTWGAWAQVTDGWYFTSVSYPDATLVFRNNSGTETIVAQKTPHIDGNIRIMFSYTY